MTGYIRTLFPDRGYGFIRCQDGRDAFLHAKNVAGLPWDHLAVGDRLWFDVEDDPHGKGPVAVNVGYMAPTGEGTAANEQAAQAS